MDSKVSTISLIEIRVTAIEKILLNTLLLTLTAILEPVYDPIIVDGTKIIPAVKSTFCKKVCTNRPVEAVIVIMNSDVATA